MGGWYSDRVTEDVTLPAPDLTPPSESRKSVILNGIGNGVMIGTVPFLALEHYANITRSPLPKGVHWGSAFAIVAGGILGGLFGKREVQDIDRYNQQLKSEITRLNQKLDANTAKMQELASKLNVPGAAPDKRR